MSGCAEVVFAGTCLKVYLIEKEGILSQPYLKFFFLLEFAFGVGNQCVCCRCEGGGEGL